jgi:integrase
MKGKINYRADRNFYYVSWFQNGKTYKISHYKGFLCRDGIMLGISGLDMANRILSLMRSDEENGVFKIEKYIQQITDVIPYLREWLTSQQPHISPATYKDYKNSIENHLIPWFQKNLFMLHEIQYDILCKLLGDIRRSGKGKLNVMYCLHACLDYAWKSGRIMVVPPFPEKSKYGMVKKEIRWLPTDRQIKVIKAIPEEHQPIFWWLKYHYRRPSEAMALHKEDYDPLRNVFVVRRAFSNKQLVEHTKTHTVHVMPCDPDFKTIMDRMPKTFSPFFFVNPCGHLKGQHYQHDYLVDLWNTACAKVGEDIPMYDGLKHSACSQYINERGGTVDELQMLTGHARRDSVLKYADVQIEARRKLMEKGKVVAINVGDAALNQS